MAVVDRQVFAAGQVVQQLLDQCQVGVVAVFVGPADVGRVADQAPEHHPHAEQVRVHHPWRKRRVEECIQARGGAFGLFHLCPQGAGQFVGQLVVGLGDQRVDAAEMVVEQANGHRGFGRDAPHGYSRMAVTGQAGERGGHQLVAALVGACTAQFGRVDRHGIAFDGRAET